MTPDRQEWPQGPHNMLPADDMLMTYAAELETGAPLPGPPPPAPGMAIAGPEPLPAVAGPGKVWMATL